jgi:putative membrane protein
MWHMSDGWGWWMVFGWIWMLGFWLLVIWAVTAIAGRRRDSHDAGQRGEAKPVAHREPSAREILDRRYASGEIDDAEYDRRRARLDGAAGNPAASHDDATP